MFYNRFYLCKITYIIKVDKFPLLENKETNKSYLLHQNTDQINIYHILAIFSSNFKKRTHYSSDDLTRS